MLIYLSTTDNTDDFFGSAKKRTHLLALSHGESLVDEYFLESKFIDGCDGANSTTRRMSFIPFEGFPWTNFRFVATDVEYDFAEHCGFSLVNYIVDPENWALISKTGKEIIWRVCYGNSTSQKYQVRICSRV